MKILYHPKTKYSMQVAQGNFSHKVNLHFYDENLPEQGPQTWCHFQVWGPQEYHSFQIHGPGVTVDRIEVYKQMGKAYVLSTPWEKRKES